MDFLDKTDDARPVMGHQETGVFSDLARLSAAAQHQLAQREQERRVRREIANSNERRRMQSINAGFQSLKALLPQQKGEKLSKAAILQQTAEYIYTLEQQKTQLLHQSCGLKRLLNHHRNENSVSKDSKRIKVSEVVVGNNGKLSSADEGIIVDLDEPSFDELQKEMIELRCQLDRERRLRMMMEERARTLETQLYPERLGGDTQTEEQREQEEKSQQLEQQALELQRQRQLLQQEKEQLLIQQQRMIAAEQQALQQQLMYSPPRHSASDIQNATKRNLETIVEAIKHLEGSCSEEECTVVSGHRRHFVSTSSDLGTSQSDTDDSPELTS